VSRLLPSGEISAHKNVTCASHDGFALRNCHRSQFNGPQNARSQRQGPLRATPTSTGCIAVEPQRQPLSFF